MNKQQVETHKECIKWWLNNPDIGVYTRRHDLPNWSISHEPDWLLNYKYVPNDKYSDLRMAQIDGKVIQFYNDYYDSSLPNRTWQTLEGSIIQTSINLYHYRIKPDKPKFKEGDWVSDDTEANCIYQLTESICDYSFIEEHCKLWQPQKDEWCVFYDDGNDYLVAKFDKSVENRHYPQEKGWFHNIAPLEFVRYFLKDK